MRFNAIAHAKPVEMTDAAATASRWNTALSAEGKKVFVARLVTPANPDNSATAQTTGLRKGALAELAEDGEDAGSARSAASRERYQDTNTIPPITATPA